MNLNEKDWKEFIVGDIFDCNTTSALDINEAVEGNIPYITRSALNNGLTDYYGNTEKIVKGNCITIGAEGTIAFYQPDDFIPGVKIYTIRHEKLNYFNAMFILTLLNSCAYLYSYGRARILEKLKQETIKLPINSAGEIDWQFMEDYIKSLNHKSITTKNKMCNFTTLEKNDWKEYKLGQLFNDIYKADAHVKNDIDNFEYGNSDRLEFITRTDINNGCDCFVNKNDVNGIEKGNAIIIGDTTSTIYYQENNFVTGDHIVVCRADWINKYTALFLKTILEKERYRYSYGRAFKMDLIKSTIVKLPTKDDEPNWEYMENYIKSLPYGDRI